MIKILIVDDDINLCKPMKKFFEQKNYDVNMVHNGTDALSFIRSNRPHLVFLDVGLPDMSGLDVLKSIHEMKDTIKVIMITAYDSEEKMMQARELGVSEYIKKPFTLDYLEEEGLMKVQRQLFEELRRKHEREYLIRTMFQKYVPEYVVNEVLDNSKEIFTSKKVKVTVLLSDIRNSCNLAMEMMPEEVVTLLNSYFSEMTKPIYKNGGIVDKFIGDAIMGVFGVPASSGRDAKNAVIAAWEIIRQLDIFNMKNKGKYEEVVVGIGISTGEVVAGNIGCEEKIEYTVIGDAVNITSRIEELTKEHPNGILISETTYNEVKDIVEVEELGKILPDRKNESIYKIKKVLSASK